MTYVTYTGGMTTENTQTPQGVTIAEAADGNVRLYCERCEMDTLWDGRAGVLALLRFIGEHEDTDHPTLRVAGGVGRLVEAIEGATGTDFPEGMRVSFETLTGRRYGTVVGYVTTATRGRLVSVEVPSGGTFDVAPESLDIERDGQFVPDVVRNPEGGR